MEIGAFIKPLTLSLLMSVLGLKFIYDWTQGDIPNLITALRLPRSIHLVSGVLLQIPTAIFIYAVISGQGGV